jgi:hypothetical protein
MFDDLDRLRGNARLLRLLDHYAQPALTNPEAWQDRLMSLDGAEPGPMVKLHGELLAFGWIEQNSGYTFNQPGVVAACYRITNAGLKALKKISREKKGETEEEGCLKLAA